MANKLTGSEKKTIHRYLFNHSAVKDLCGTHITREGTPALVKKYLREIEGLAEKRLIEEEDGPRFWLDEDPLEKPFGDHTVGIVDECAGGVVLYANTYSWAKRMLMFLRRND